MVIKQKYPALTRSHPSHQENKYIPANKNPKATTRARIRGRTTFSYDQTTIVRWSFTNLLCRHPTFFSNFIIFDLNLINSRNILILLTSPNNATKTTADTTVPELQDFAVEVSNFCHQHNHQRHPKQCVDYCEELRDKSDFNCHNPSPSTSPKSKVQSPKSKALGVTLFCCATTHHHHTNFFQQPDKQLTHLTKTKWFGLWQSRVQL